MLARSKRKQVLAHACTGKDGGRKHLKRDETVRNKAANADNDASHGEERGDDTVARIGQEITGKRAIGAMKHYGVNYRIGGAHQVRRVKETKVNRSVTRQESRGIAVHAPLPPSTSTIAQVSGLPPQHRGAAPQHT